MSTHEATLEALRYWRTLDDDDRSAFLVHLQESIAVLSAEGNERSLSATVTSLDLFDALFLLLAIGAAYGTGSGASRELESPDEDTPAAERRLPYWLRKSGASEKPGAETKQK